MIAYSERLLPRATRYSASARTLHRATNALPSYRSARPLRCTSAQKHSSASLLFATLTHSSSRKSFPCHSYANTRNGGDPPPEFFSPRATRYSRLLSLSPFKINTYKSATKQTPLTSFRMNTYAKTGGGGYHCPCLPPFKSATHFPFSPLATSLYPRPQFLGVSAESFRSSLSSLSDLCASVANLLSSQNRYPLSAFSAYTSKLRSPCELGCKPRCSDCKHFAPKCARPCTSRSRSSSPKSAG